MVLCNEQQKRMLDYPASLFEEGFPTLEEIFRFNAERGEYGRGDVEEQVQSRLARARQSRPHTVERTRPNGVVLEIRGVPIDGGGFVTTYLDVTEQRRAQAMIAHMARHDSLTNLPNRALLLERLEQALARGRRGQRSALHYLDLDHFKPINDELGHAAGDALLKSIAARLQSTVRETDTVARLGGDEFVVLQTDIGTDMDAALMARRLIGAVKAPHALPASTVEVGASIGIAMIPTDAETADDALQAADQALGRGQFMLFATDCALGLCAETRLHSRKSQVA
jgi:diguanylate cyclase (GGDEF)-like protein